MRVLPRLILALIVFLVAGLTHDAPGAAPSIGTTAIATNRVTGSLGDQLRRLKAGDGVFLDEKIETGVKSKAQLIFKDETVLSIGPKSEVMLTKFVYDPDPNKGKVVVRAVRGAFRFISGSLSKKAYKIETPLATIGIRGTIFDFLLRARSLILWVQQGSVELCLRDGRCTFLKAGTYAITDGRKLTVSRKRATKGSPVFGGGPPNSLLNAFLGSRPPRGPSTPPAAAPPPLPPKPPVD